MSRRTRSGLRIVLAALITWSFLGAAPAAAAGSVADGVIAFTRAADVPGGYVIRSVDPSTGAQRLLARGTSPAWSPNGKRLAFVHQPDAVHGTVRIRNADGSVTRTGVPADAYTDGTHALAWSPDGTRIAFAYDDRMWLMNVAAPHRPRVISRHDGTAPSWSPDSRRIAYTAPDTEGYADIHIVRADGTGHVNLTGTPSYAEDGAEWSPDGRSFVYFSWTGETGIYVIDSDGTDERIVGSTFRDAPPTWSPTGSRIAFAGDDGTVAITASTAGGSRGIAGTAVALQMDWQPRPAYQN